MGRPYSHHLLLMDSLTIRYNYNVVESSFPATLGSRGPSLSQRLYANPAARPRKTLFLGPSVYPPSCPSSSFQEPAEKYHAALLSLSEPLMRLIALTLPSVPDIFERFLAPDPAAPLRLLHYPPMPPRLQLDGQEECGRSQFGARRHADIGAITILLQDSSPALQVEHLRSPATCLLVPPREDAFVINLGDMLSMWTRAGHRCSVRRVVSKPGGKERYSVVFYLDERLDCEPGTLGGEGGEGKVQIVEEHMLERMASLYGRGNKVGDEDGLVV